MYFIKSYRILWINIENISIFVCICFLLFQEQHEAQSVKMLNDVSLGEALQCFNPHLFSYNPHFIITDWAGKSKMSWNVLMYSPDVHSLKTAALGTHSREGTCLVREGKLILPTENVQWLTGESSKKLNNYATKSKVQSRAHKCARATVAMTHRVNLCR